MSHDATVSEWLCGVQEEEERQIALLDEAMRVSPSLASALSDQLRDNTSMRSFRGGHEPRRSFSTMDNRSHLVSSPFTRSFFLLVIACIRRIVHFKKSLRELVQAVRTTSA